MLKFISCIAVVIGLVASARAAENADVKLTQEQDAVHVTIGGKPFTTYHVGSNDGKPYVRPFFYPVRAADGTPVTADQLTEGGDHPHHRSMYVAHGAVNGADHWALRGANSPKQRHAKFNKVEGNTIEQALVWEDKAGEPMLKENRTLRFAALPDGSRAVDFTLVFEPVDEPVTFEDTKEAGLCTIRAAKQISQKGSVVVANATGATGEKNIWGKPAKWCDISGKIDGKPYGIAILDHPSNPRHPSNWHVREYGLMGANVFGLHDFDKKNPKGTGDFKMEKGKPVTFKYRVIIHPGDAKSAELDEKWANFASAK
jgi:hypothetical protein